MAYLKSVEQQIKEAMARGEFDDLPGKGEPIDLVEYFKTPAHLRLAYKILKDAGYIPPELVIKKEIENLKKKRKSTTDEKEKNRLDREINIKTSIYHMSLEQTRTTE